MVVFDARASDHTGIGVDDGGGELRQCSPTIRRIDIDACLARWHAKRDRFQSPQLRENATREVEVSANQLEPKAFGPAPREDARSPAIGKDDLDARNVREGPLDGGKPRGKFVEVIAHVKRERRDALERSRLGEDRRE